MISVKDLDRPDVFGVAVCRNGKKGWLASVCAIDGVTWTPNCAGKTPALALAAALERVAADDGEDDMDFG